VTHWLVCYALSKEFGWTPDEIRAMKNKDVLAYLAVMAGEVKQRKAEQSKSELKGRLYGH